MTPNCEAIDPADLSNTERVFQAVCELVAMRQGVTPKAVQDLTGLQKGAVDDRLRALADCGRIRRLTRGFYGTVDSYAPPRLVYTGILEDGSHTLEVGDDKWILSPEEFRRVATLTAGGAVHHAAIHAASTSQQQMAEIAQELTSVRQLLRTAQAELEEVRATRSQTTLAL